MNFPFSPLIPYSFNVINCDPPWSWSAWSECGEKKSAQAQYDVMELRRVQALPVSKLAQKDCILFLWATAPLLPEAIDTMRGWGFSYKSTIIWRKVGKTGKVRQGTGYWARTMHEQVLIGAMGNPYALTTGAFPSLFDGCSREHSRKPDEWYRLVEDRCPQSNRVDLFSRQSRDGWKTWGFERSKFDASE